MIDIIAIGEPMIEFANFSNINGQAKYLQGFGGDTSNFVIALARQGNRVGYFTHVGYDTFGRMFMELWHQNKVDVSKVKLSNKAHTGVYFITYNDKGHEFSYLRKNSAASKIKPSDLPISYFSKAKVLHVSGISQAISLSMRKTVDKAIEIANKNKATIVYDPNIRLKLWDVDLARKVILKTLRKVDIFMPSYEDAVSLTGLKDAKEIVRYFLNHGVKLVILKLGAKGVLVATKDKQTMIKGYKVKTLDQTGAGDTFDGAFVSQYLLLKDPFKAAKYANAAAALSTLGYGAVGPIPTRTMVEKFLKKKI
jgi:2-dehydro-3-deoxygluconokinase